MSDIRFVDPGIELDRQMSIGDCGCVVSHPSCLTTVYLIVSVNLVFRRVEKLMVQTVCPWCLPNLERADNFIGTDLEVAAYLARRK